MKKSFYFLGVALTSLFYGCQNEVRPVEIGDIQPEKIQRVLIWGETGMTCGACGYGALQVEQMVSLFGNNIIPIMVHRGDTLETPVGTAMLPNFPSGTTPNFYVNSTDTEDTIELVEVAELVEQSPIAGVGHKWEDKDFGRIRIIPKVEFFSNIEGEFFLGTYILNGDIEAKGRFAQLEESDFLDTVRVANVLTSVWKQTRVDALGNPVVFANEVFLHKYSLFTAAHDDPFGELLPGKVIRAGDTFFKEYEVQLPFTYDTENMHIVSILWKFENGEYKYVNGYMQ